MRIAYSSISNDTNDNDDDDDDDNDNDDDAVRCCRAYETQP